MKISLEWLSEFVTWKETDPQAIADRLTLGVAEVEEVEMQGKLLHHCCVGEVMSVERHPDADRLCIAKVKTDKGEKTVVCGGTNVTTGMHVAFAHVGATVKWHGGELMKLEPVKIRGVASEGMICAAEELGLESMFPPEKEDGERPIINLSRLHSKNKKLQTGSSLKSALNLDDSVFHVNNTAITMRPDLFSHLGFARECVALGIAKWKKEPSFKLPKFPTKKSSLKVTLDDKGLASRYLGCLLEISSLGETPDWMKKRLEAAGYRSVSLPVDITNYVSAEIGAPMHSFDADDIKGTAHMRLSKKGEMITTLDNEKRQLPDGALVLSDDEGIFDLVGIMGGLRSSTKPTTKHIYLHAASLDPAAVRRGIIGTGHRTDAATVYEKGVSAITAEQGFIRALELFLELVPGAKMMSALDSHGSIGKMPTITLATNEVRSTLGVDVSDAEITKILTSLECAVKKGVKGSLAVTLPAHRLRDLTGSHDLIEEVGRIYGFDKIKPAMPTASVSLPKRDQRIHHMRDSLKEQGFWETVPLSFVSPALLKKSHITEHSVVRIKNPLGEETSLLQPSTLPSLLSNAQSNLQRADGNSLQLFTWSHVFSSAEKEHTELGALVVALTEPTLLTDPFLQTKQNVLRAIHNAGYSATVDTVETVPSFAHPGRTAAIIVNGKTVGTVFEVHPLVRSAFDLPFRAAASLINISELFSHAAAIATAKSTPSFPAIRYDITVLRTQKQPVGPLLSTLKKGHELLEDVRVQDLYAGKPLTGDQYNLTLRFTYRSPDRTLTEDEAKKAHEQVLASAGIK